MAFVIAGQESRSRIMRERWDRGRNATQRYKRRLSELVKPGMRILHAGCGWDRLEVSRPYIGTCKVVGVDLDPRVASMYHSEFHLGSLAELPFEANSFDLIFCEYVVEHLDDPASAFREMHRVLKPGGRILVLTPNRYSYKVLGAAITPHQFHIWMGRIRYGRGHEADMYPTLYRCNSPGQIQRLARDIGLRITQSELITNGPTWFERFPGLFMLFDLFHRTIARQEALRHLRCALLVELQKPESAAEASAARRPTPGP
jgi:ubiquinone/menaquinone biosynthesis C-methylase UbiE